MTSKPQRVWDFFLATIHTHLLLLKESFSGRTRFSYMIYLVHLKYRNLSSYSFFASFYSKINLWIQLLHSFNLNPSAFTLFRDKLLIDQTQKVSVNSPYPLWSFWHHLELRQSCPLLRHCVVLKRVDQIYHISETCPTTEPPL